MEKQKIGLILLIISAIVAIGSMFFIDPITQDQAYHNFIDDKKILGIPNFWNVVSNLPFLVVGLLGMGRINFLAGTLHLYRVFFLGLIIVTFGSAYYHLAPDNFTLVWDRLPMTISFMALFSIVICEFISVQLGKQLFMPLLAAGLFSVIIWYYGPQSDLRMYALIQFYPMIAIPIIIIFYTSKFDRAWAYWVLLGFYVIAKLLEHFDKEIYEFLGFMSGHPLKHIFAAIGLYILYLSFKNRKEIANS